MAITNANNTQQKATAPKTGTPRKRTGAAGPTEEKTAKPAAKKFEYGDMIAVKSNFNGRLKYLSSRTGFEAEWEAQGDVAYISVEELLVMRNTQNAFFKNNWIVFEKDIAEDLYKYLSVAQHYTNCVLASDYVTLFKAAPAKITATIKAMSGSAKDNLARAAAQMIAERSLDSLRAIDAIESGLGYKISEE